MGKFSFIIQIFDEPLNVILVFDVHTGSCYFEHNNIFNSLSLYLFTLATIWQSSIKNVE